MAPCAPSDADERGRRAQESVIVPEGSVRGPNIRDIESLRIERPASPLPRRRLAPAAIALAVAAVIAAGGYAVYTRTVGRPSAVQTAVASLRTGGQTALTGSGYVVTQHKYIVIGTKILGQIVEEPIADGQHVRRGDLLARIDDRDYQAQLQQAYANRDLAVANVKLKQARAERLRELYKQGVQSKDSLDDAENQLSVAEAELKRAEG